MIATRHSSMFTLLLLLTILAAACTPPRSRGGNGGGGNNEDPVADDDDEAVGDDDDSVGDDDDSVGDDDDSVGDDDDSVGGTLYAGEVYGGLKGADGGGDCNGTAEISIDADGTVLSGVLSCGDDCTVEFEGAYAFGEEQFAPGIDCAVNGYTPNLSEVDAWIWGSVGQYAEGSVNGYGDGDYFYLNFTTYPAVP